MNNNTNERDIKQKEASFNQKIVSRIIFNFLVECEPTVYF